MDWSRTLLLGSGAVAVGLSGGLGRGKDGVDPWLHFILEEFKWLGIRTNLNLACRSLLLACSVDKSASALAYFPYRRAAGSSQTSTPIHTVHCKPSTTCCLLAVTLPS